MSKIQLNGTELEYFEKGEGEPVILVHGTLGDFRSWELQMDNFAEKFRTITYSRRYHYPNHCEGDETDYSAALHADDLAEFISGLGLDSAHIIGNSYGAYTSLLLAAWYPEKIKSQVLGEPPVFPLLKNSKKGRELRDEFLENIWKPSGKILQKGKMEKGVKRFVDGVVEKGAFDQFPKEVQDLIMDNACEFKAETSSPEFWTSFSHQDASSIEIPTLLLTGEQSLRMFQLIVEELHNCLPNNELVIIPKSTHEMPADNPEAYNRIVLEFLKKHTF